MAVDTAQKRRSMISFGRMNYAERVPAATNFDSAEDRAQALWLYAGFAPSGGVSSSDDPITVRPRLGTLLTVNASVGPSIVVRPTISTL